MIAHVGPVPVEEIVPAVSGAGALLFVRAWIGLRRRGPGGRRDTGHG